MNIAIPKFGNRVAPRFDCTSEFVIYKIVDRQILERKLINIRMLNPIMRINELIDYEITDLICGAINMFTIRYAINKGINVIPWVTGNLESIMEIYLKGELKEGYSISPNGRAFTRKRHRKRRRGY